MPPCFGSRGAPRHRQSGAAAGWGCPGGLSPPCVATEAFKSPGCRWGGHACCAPQPSLGAVTSGRGAEGGHGRLRPHSSGWKGEKGCGPPPGRRQGPFGKPSGWVSSRRALAAAPGSRPTLLDKGQSSPGPGGCMGAGLERWGRCPCAWGAAPRWKGSPLLLCPPARCLLARTCGRAQSTTLLVAASRQGLAGPCLAAPPALTPLLPPWLSQNPPSPPGAAAARGGAQGSLGACKGLAARLGSCLHADGTGYSQPRSAGAVLSQGPGARPAPPRQAPHPEGHPRQRCAPPRLQSTACQLRYAALEGCSSIQATGTSERFLSSLIKVLTA